MKKRLILSFMITLGLLVLILTVNGPGQTVAAKTDPPAPKIGVIDLNKIKKEAPRFIRLEEMKKANREKLEEFTAQVLAEHHQQIKELAGEDYARSQELAVATQMRIDQKRRELEENYRQEEAAVQEEFQAVLAKVTKDKGLDCILLKGSLQVGGEDVTEKVLKTWEKWGLTFWQRLFFNKKNKRP